MHEDHGGGVVFQGDLDDFPGVHAGAVQRPSKHFVKRKHAVAAVEHQQREHFMLIVGQQRLQVAEHLVG